MCAVRPEGLSDFYPTVRDCRTVEQSIALGWPVSRIMRATGCTYAQVRSVVARMARRNYSEAQR